MTNSAIDAEMKERYGATFLTELHDECEDDGQRDAVRFYANGKTAQRFLVDVSQDGTAAVYTYDRTLGRD